MISLQLTTLPLQWQYAAHMVGAIPAPRIAEGAMWIGEASCLIGFGLDRLVYG